MSDLMTRDMTRDALAELRELRAAVPGVLNSLLVTVDGLLITHDCLEDDGTEQTGALSSTLLALATHAVGLTARGEMLDAAVRGSEGWFVVYAVGDAAVLAVIGDDDLNLALLHLRTRPIVRRLAGLTDGFARFVSVTAPEPPAAAATPRSGAARR